MKRFTEEDIRACMDQHYPVGDMEYEDNGVEAFCYCGQKSGIWEQPPRYRPMYIQFDADHFLAALTAQRLERK